MTAPAQAQPQQQPGMTDGEEAAVGALATFLAEVSLAAVVTVPPTIYALLLGLGFKRRAVDMALHVALRPPLYQRPLGPRVMGSVRQQIGDEEPLMRARYIVNAARRLTEALLHPPAGMPIRGLLETAARQERRFWRQHLDAQRKRRVAARDLDEAFTRSTWLVWRVNPLLNNTPGCLWANGQIFTRDQPLVFTDDSYPARPQWPGAVHPKCGCHGDPLVADNVTPIFRS